MNLSEISIELKTTSESLSDQSKAFAEWLSAAMEKACVSKICGIELVSSVGSFDVLLLSGEDLLSAMGVKSYYEHGDFTCEVQRPSRDTVEKFISLLPQILERLEELSNPVKFPKLAI